MKETARNLYNLIVSFIKGAKTDKRKRITVIVICVALALIVGNTIRNNATTEEAPKQVRQVTIATLAELSGNGTDLVMTGTVESQSEADIRAEAQGQIIRVQKQLGSYVSAGDIIAEIENGYERAQVAQAQASVDAAIAARSEQSSVTSIQLDNAQHANEQERVSAINTVLQAYTLAENAIYGKADQFFTNPRTSAPHLNISSYGIDDLSARRATIGDSFIVWKKTLDTISSATDMSHELSDAENRLRFMSSFMRDMADIVTRQGTSTEVSDILSGRTSIDTALSNVLSAQEALRSAETAYKIAQENSAQISGTGLTTREAAVRQAEAGRALAVASLEKKIIRAPISGTINSLSIAVGDVVSPGQALAVVANNNALRVKTYITEQEKTYVRVGAAVAIGNTYTGTVVAISPALDPITHKIEVIIGVADTATDMLVNGQSVRVSIARTGDVAHVDVHEGIRIPIAALNIGTEQTSVFGLNEDNTVVAYKVDIGPVFGDTVLIKGDLDPTLRIVTDARGLKVGQTVSVSEE